jgi:hypothetical protein
VNTVEIKLLQRWRVDRQAGATANGPEQLVILVLKANDGREAAYACSKVDAMAIAIQMQLAATDAQGS